MITLTLVTAAAAAPVRVRGGARLEARAANVDDGAFELRGKLADDDGAVIPGGVVSVISDDTASWSPATSCVRPRLDVSRSRSSQAALVHVGPKGELCVRWHQAPSRGRLRLRFAGDDYHAAADLDVDFDRTRPPRRPTTLRFDPRPLVVDVDRGPVVLSAVLSLAPANEDELGPLPAASVGGRSVTLYDEEGRALVVAATSGDGKVKLAIEGKELREPGDERFLARFDGAQELEPSSDEQRVTLRATVHLRLLGQEPSARPGEPTQLEVAAEAERGTVASGVVEARMGGLSVTTVPVLSGRAFVVLPAGDSASDAARVTLRYVPAAPSWVAGRDLEVQLAVARNARLGAWIWGIVVGAVLLWTAWSWRRSRRARHDPRPAQREKPGIRLVGRPTRAAVWTGVVIDAHDGLPIAHAKLDVRSATTRDAGDRPPLVSLVTDEEGRFRFDFGGRPAGEDIIVTAAARLHSSVETHLPPAGELRVVLTTRRRALLDRLVGWARSRGRPFFVSPEPTPAHVAEVAAEEPPVARWARGVERAAFGPGEVDEAVEREVVANEPTPGGALDPKDVAREEEVGTWAVAAADGAGEEPRATRQGPSVQRIGVDRREARTGPPAESHPRAVHEGDEEQGPGPEHLPS